MIIKIFGLYSIILSLFSFLPSNITNIFIYKDEIWMLLVIFGTVLLSIALFLILIFKSDFIIDKLGLDKGFDDDKLIFGDFKNEQIFKLSIILIGGFLIVDYFPRVLFEMINIFKTKSSSNSIYGHEVDYFGFIVGIVNIIIGLFFITNYKSIAAYLDKK
jgi:magnesium-transporting ATPase (P-type)